MDYIDQLNKSQREAVLNVEGPCLVIAGAGSGKTRVLTYRIAHLIKKHNVDPFSILALTFTNKASNEMKDRIEQVVGTDARNLWMGTFHSVFARILRAEGNKIGYPSNFTIYDTQDSKSLIKSIVQEMGYDNKLYKENYIYNRISNAKNRLISYNEYLNNKIIQEEDISSLRPNIGIIYRKYVKRCFKSQAMDFDDLLFNTNLLFKDHVDVLNKYQQKFHYVLIDEFQDTNFSQYLITKKLSAVKRNICVVGDDAQSIYAFRGADINNILNFEKDYPELNLVKLEQNYRSTKNIVGAANSIIKNNTSKISKSIWTNNQEGELISIKKSFSDNQEGKMVSSLIFEEKNKNHYSNSNFAVLYRTNSQSRSIEEALRRIGIEYKVYGGISFYQRKEVKDLIAYLRFTINQNDEQSLRRIINFPRRGIGKNTLEKIILIANENNLKIWDIILDAKKYFNSRTASSLEKFSDLIKGFIIYSKNNDAYTSASHICSLSGLTKEFYDDKTIEGLNKYENIQELLNSIKEFIDTDNKESSIDSFLQEIALLTDQDSENNDENYVSLMTVHMAKGLEFEVIFIVGMEEDLFPSQMMLSSRNDLEEERRLFYVAVTRAMKKLYLTYSNTRYRYGILKECQPSRFIDEIDQNYIENSFGIAKNRNFAKNLISDNKNKIQNNIIHNPSKNFIESDLNDLKEGMEIEHKKFGYGLIKSIDKTQNHQKAVVNFKLVGEKTLLLSFARLRIVK